MMLESHWNELEHEEYEQHRAIVGDLDGLDEPATEALVPAGEGHDGEDVQGVFDRLREKDPDDPFWKGIAETSVEPGGVRFRFHEPFDPRELTVGNSVVRCHLHDPEIPGSPAGSS
jgi:hypothetical protein